MAMEINKLSPHTGAEITGVDRVLVKDIEALFKIRQDPGRGFQIELWDRIDPGASFIEIFFRGRIFADGAEACRYPQQIRLAKRLIADYDHHMVEPRPINPGRRIRVDLAGEIDAGDFGAGMGR